MAIIAHAGGVITPTAVHGYASSRRSNNVIHPILGNDNPDVTLRPASLRSGTLKLVFDAEAAAKEAEDVHATGAGFTLASTGRATVDMHYVVDGEVRRELGAAGEWVVTVGYQEIRQ